MAEHILETADRLFYRDGIRAVGVDTIAAEAGISKRTIYNHFRSKDALITAYLQRRVRPIPPSDAPTLEQILGLFDRLERGFTRAGFRGCPFVNAVAELGETRHPAHGVARAFKEQRRLWFRDQVARLGIAGSDGLAMQLSVLLDGAIVTALVCGDPAAAHAARDAARVLLERAMARSPHRGGPQRSRAPKTLAR